MVPVNERRIALQTGDSVRPMWLALIGLNVACVLEPMVGVVWQACLARVAGAHLGFAQTLLLGVGLWIMYAADRALDARAPLRPDTLRHAFFARHLGKLAMLIAVVSSSALGFGLSTLSAAEWSSAGAVFAMALAYLLIVHRLGTPKWAKKALAAAIYTLGVGAFVWPNADRTAPLLLGQLALTLLAGCNLAVISMLEVNADKVQMRRATTGCVTVGFGASIAAIGASDARPLLLGIATSALLLAALLVPSNRHRELSHALADLVLLLPLLAAT
jgi:hypothetical protein